MKRLLFLILLLFSLASSAQEELFGDNSGISLTYLQAFYEDAEPAFGLGFNALVKKSIAINVGFVSNDGYTLLWPDWHISANPMSRSLDGTLARLILAT